MINAKKQKNKESTSNLSEGSENSGPSPGLFANDPTSLGSDAIHEEKRTETGSDHLHPIAASGVTLPIHSGSQPMSAASSSSSMNQSTSSTATPSVTPTTPTKIPPMTLENFTPSVVNSPSTNIGGGGGGGGGDASGGGTDGGSDVGVSHGLIEIENIVIPQAPAPAPAPQAPPTPELAHEPPPPPPQPSSSSSSSTIAPHFITSSHDIVPPIIPTSVDAPTSVSAPVTTNIPTSIPVTVEAISAKEVDIGGGADGGANGDASGSSRSAASSSTKEATADDDGVPTTKESKIQAMRARLNARRGIKQEIKPSAEIPSSSTDEGIALEGKAAEEKAAEGKVLSVTEKPTETVMSSEKTHFSTLEPTPTPTTMEATPTMEATIETIAEAYPEPNNEFTEQAFQYEKTKAFVSEKSMGSEIRSVAVGSEKMSVGGSEKASSVAGNIHQPDNVLDNEVSDQEENHGSEWKGDHEEVSQEGPELGAGSVPAQGPGLVPNASGLGLAQSTTMVETETEVEGDKIVTTVTAVTVTAPSSSSSSVTLINRLGPPPVLTVQASLDATTSTQPSSSTQASSSSATTNDTIIPTNSTISDPITVSDHNSMRTTQPSRLHPSISYPPSGGGVRAETGPVPGKSSASSSSSSSSSWKRDDLPSTSTEASLPLPLPRSRSIVTKRNQVAVVSDADTNAHPQPQSQIQSQSQSQIHSRSEKQTSSSSSSSSSAAVTTTAAATNVLPPASHATIKRPVGRMPWEPLPTPNPTPAITGSTAYAPITTGHSQNPTTKTNRKPPVPDRHTTNSGNTGVGIHKPMSLEETTNLRYTDSSVVIVPQMVSISSNASLLPENNSSSTTNQAEDETKTSATPTTTTNNSNSNNELVLDMSHKTELDTLDMRDAYFFPTANLQVPHIPSPPLSISITHPFDQQRLTPPFPPIPPHPIPPHAIPPTHAIPPQHLRVLLLRNCAFTDLSSLHLETLELVTGTVLSL